LQNGVGWSTSSRISGGPSGDPEAAASDREPGDSRWQNWYSR